MTEKQLRPFSKFEMLELLRQQKIEIERLKAEKETAVKRRNEHRMVIGDAGSIAEASAMLSGVISEAQAAADLYLENVKTIEAEKKAETDRIEYDAREKIAAMFSGAERKSDEILAQTGGILTEMQNLFDWHLGKIIDVFADIHEVIRKSGFAESSKDDGSDEGNE